VSRPVQLRWFAGNQIRNTASVGGNIVTGSPISDLNPIYMAAAAVFTVVGEGSEERHIPADKFFLGYRCARPPPSPSPSPSPSRLASFGPPRLLRQ
jgi:xanthine dehydrogenase iron-sulfur cluster and FAD-binding subunit A